MDEKTSRKRNNNDQNGNTPTFTVHDEIRRDRRIALNKRIRQARKRSRKAIAVLLALFVILFTLIAVVFVVTRAQVVTVSGNSRYTSDEIISAADINGDVLLLLTDNSVYKKIVLDCPYIDNVKLKKTYPSSVELVVSETESVYYSYLHGVPYSLDENLRVIEFIENNEGLVQLTLPHVSKAIEGETLNFSDDRYDTLIPEVLDELFGEFTLPFVSVDLSNRFSITAATVGKAKIYFGDYNDLALKLQAAAKLIKIAEEEGSKKTYVNVSKLDGAGPSMILDYEGEI